MVTVALSSASYLLTLFKGTQDEDLKINILNKLNEIVDSFWFEISEAVSDLEGLCKDPQFAYRKLVSLLVSKIYYHFEDYEKSLDFAICAEEHLCLSEDTEYSRVMRSQCIDKYVRMRKAVRNANRVAPSDSIAPNDEVLSPNPLSYCDTHLEGIIESLFECFLKQGLYNEVISIAMESERLDVVERVISLFHNNDDVLNYVKDVSIKFIDSGPLRTDLLNIVMKKYLEKSPLDVCSIVECWVYLNDGYKDFLSVVVRLIDQGDEDSVLLVYQLCFSIYENADMVSLNNCIGAIGNKIEENKEVLDFREKEKIYTSILEILSGRKSVALYLQFLYRNNKVDFSILQTTKSFLNVKMSVHHSGFTFCHSLMLFGTTNDDFLRNNIEFFSYANNWSKFSATAGLGLVHNGQYSQSMRLLSSYLPRDDSSESAYSEGGALFALGLIHSRSGSLVTQYLMEKLKNANNEVVQHGACLGLGITGMASEDVEIFDVLKSILYTDSAVASESAGLAMGLVYLGSGCSTAVEEMLRYAYDTEHEKIIRGLSLGIALIMYGRESGADVVIEQMVVDKDPILRYGAVYCIALAYNGTSNRKMVRKLLHIAVSDSNDDVRRAAVTSIGFLLFKQPDHVPQMVQLLLESYNPHVRYGAAMAIGIACCSTGSAEALRLLEPLTDDMCDFVRQGALISIGMVFMQRTETQCPKSVHIRSMYEKIISNKHEDPIAKFGAIVSQGILDAGGRNVCLSLLTPLGRSDTYGVVGMALFTQFWYWYPMIHFISMSLKPICAIGLTSDLKIPKTQFVSDTKPSMYAYPLIVRTPSGTPDKVATAVLSVTARAKARAKKTEKKIDPVSVSHQVDDSQKQGEENFTLVENLSRVFPEQWKHMRTPENSRYQPVLGRFNGGIFMLSDLSKDTPREYIETEDLSKQ